MKQTIVAIFAFIATCSLMAQTGKVLEVFDSSGYTYLKLATEQGEQWAAIGQTEVKVGDVVTLQNPMIMSNFTAKSLNRTFEEIYFASGVSFAGAPVANPMAELSKKDVTPSGNPIATLAQQGQPVKPHSAGTPTGGATPSAHPGHQSAAPVEVIESIDKAEGPAGYRIEALFQQGAGLNQQKVRVRGKVTKVLKQIMNRTWIHLQDGSGASKNGTHDLVVTTNAFLPQLGEVILVEGILAHNKDFGAGYRYLVILEEGQLISEP